jgi:hypothetical protein
MINTKKLFLAFATAITLLFTTCEQPTSGSVFDGINDRPELPPAPPAPSRLRAVAGDGVVTLSWTALPDARSYAVYLSAAGTPPSSASDDPRSPVSVFTELVNKTTYYFWVKAVYDNGESDFSPVARATPWPTGERPADPGELTVLPGASQLAVTWEDVGGAASYDVYINTNLTRPAQPQTSVGEPSCILPGLVNDTIYYIWVRARNDSGESAAFSPVKAGVPKTPTAPPEAPSAPFVTIGSRSLGVTWEPVEMASAYEVWYGTGSNVASASQYGEDIGAAEELAVTIGGLTNGVSYYLWVRGKNSAGTGAFSPAAFAVPSALEGIPDAPQAPQVTEGYESLGVNWQAAEGAVTYEVWTGATDNLSGAARYGSETAGLSMTVGGLENGVTCYVWVKAKNGKGESVSPAASGTPSVYAKAPAAPGAPTLTVGSGQLSVSWAAVSGAAAYEVWAGTSSDSAAATKRGADVTGLSAVITGLTNGATYYVWLRAKNLAGTSGFGPGASATPVVSAGAPGVSSAPSVSLGNGFLTVSWIAVTGATSYEVWKNTTNDSSGAEKYGSDTTANSKTITGLSNGMTYYVWIKAKNANGPSGFSPVASGKPMAAVGTPVLTVSASGSISVSWGAVTGADQYDIFYSTGTTAPSTPAQTVSGTGTTITGLTNGTTYRVWVRGKNTTGTGTISAYASAKPIADAGAVTVTAGTGTLALSWAAIPGADQYEVFHNTTDFMPATATQTVSTSSATITGLIDGEVYYVWVRGKNANGTGVSASASATLIAAPTAPTLTPGYGQISVSWTAVPGAASYEVYYGIGTAGILWTTVPGTSAVITGLTNDTAYAVRLRALNANGVSDYSASVSATPGIVHKLYKTAISEENKIGWFRLSDAFSYISANAVSSDGFFILLTENVTVPPTTLYYPGKTVSITLKGEDSERTVQLSANGSLFTVNSGVTLTLEENVTLVGRGSNSASLITVNSGGTLVMEDGAKVSGNTNTSSASSIYGGGGVYVIGTFAMNGGEISGNIVAGSGGGVYVYSGTFRMNGGKISGNTAPTWHGGGVFIYSGTFTMSEGEISGNTAGGRGGGVLFHSGTFTMSGGIIYGNAASLPSGVDTSLANTGVYAALQVESGSAKFGSSGGHIGSAAYMANAELPASTNETITAP